MRAWPPPPLTRFTKPSLTPLLLLFLHIIASLISRKETLDFRSSFELFILLLLIFRTLRRPPVNARKHGAQCTRLG